MSETGLEESLKPIPSDKRTSTYTKYTLTFASDLIALYSFMMGAAAIAAGLNMFQAFVAMFIGLGIDVVLLVLNGLPGFRLGIPMVVQMRPCFGSSSAKLTGIIRAIPAIAWLGFNSWLGALGLNIFSIILFGYSNIWLWFIVFQLAQIVLSALGVKKIFDFNTYAAIVLFTLILVMAGYIFYQYGFSPSQELTRAGTWGAPFLLTITAYVSVGIAVVVNSSDYLRAIKNDSVPKLVLAETLGLVPAMVILSFLGMMSVSVTGVWSPIDLFVKYVPSFLLIFVAMIFIILGQISTNMFANIIPANYVWMDIFKMPWWLATIISGAIGFLIVPWYLTTSSGFFQFMNLYGALMGPISGIMITDWLFIRKQSYQMEALYGETNEYRYWKGINPAGILALIIGTAVGLWNMNISSISGLVVGGLAYWALYKFWVAGKFTGKEVVK